MSSDERPTDRQLEYAASLGIRVDHDIARRDLSALIEEALVLKHPPSEGNLRVAGELNLMPSRPMTKRNLFDYIWSELLRTERDEDLAAFFVHRICRGYVRGGADHPEASGVNAPAVRAIARELIADGKVMASMRRYTGRELIWFGQWTTPDGWVTQGGSNRTIAYRAASKLIGGRLREVQAQSGDEGPSAQPSTRPPERLKFIRVLAIVVALYVLSLIVSRFMR